MAIGDNDQIDGEKFHFLHGNVVPPKTRVSIEDRPGVDGMDFFEEGRDKGTPFVLRSGVDTATMLDGEKLLMTYLGKIAGSDVVLKKAGVDFSTDLLEADRFKVQILDVRKISLHAITSAINGINAPSAAYLECEWTLVSVPVPTA